MENVADALKISFAIFMFIACLSLLFIMTSKVKSTADIMFDHTDKTNFYGHAVSRDKIVEYKDVVAAVNRCKTNLMHVKIKLKTSSELNYDSTLLNQSEISDLLSLTKNKKFKEEFVEVPINGEYIYSTNGSEIIVNSGAKKIYITYTET